MSTSLQSIDCTAPRTGWTDRVAALFEVSSNAARMLPMEGLRGLAVLLVFMVHYQALFVPVVLPGAKSTAIAGFLSATGHSGVDLFFLLSGYLIYGAALKPSLRFWQFIRRRIHRIYPTFLTVFIIYLILFQIFPEKSKLPESPGHAFGLIIANVLLLPGIFNITALVTVAWSLSYEFFFYLTMPAIVFLTGMYHWRRDRRVGLIVAGSVLFYAVCWWASVIHVRLLMFSAGALLYEAKSSTWLLSRLSRGGEIFSAALFVAGVAASGLFTPPLVNMFDSRSLNIRILPLLLSMWLLTLFCFHFPGRLQKVFSYTPLRYWGNISYSYYLCHGMVLHGLVVLYRQIPVQFQPHGSFAFWLIAPIALAVTIAGGAVLFLCVERPMSLSTAPVAVTRTAVAEDVRKAGYGA